MNPEFFFFERPQKTCLDPFLMKRKSPCSSTLSIFNENFWNWEVCKFGAIFGDKKSRFSLFYTFGVLGNPQRDSSMQNKWKNYIFGPFWTIFGSKNGKNEQKWALFSQKWVFRDFFAIFASFLGCVFHKEHIGTIFGSFWTIFGSKNSKIGKNQHFSAKMGIFSWLFCIFCNITGWDKA